MILLERLSPSEFHHGDCIGADKEAHEMVREFHPECLIVGHPPSNQIKRAGTLCDIFRPALPYLDRNHAIVDAVSVLIAAPKDPSEQLRSGTWATIRYARGKIPVHILPLVP